MPTGGIDVMQHQLAETRAEYGGLWTIDKLNILEHYLDSYTTALKNAPFRLLYIDGFAGTGRVELGRDATEFIQGSATRALLTADRPFDRLVLVETDPYRYSELVRLQEEHNGRDIHVINMDANEFLKDLRQNWREWRGVLFLDPFATQVEWSTIERIAGFKALDTWIMFPVSAIARMLPTSRRPDDIDPGWVARLTRVFGDESWRGLYRQNPQLTLFGDVEHERDRGVKELVEIYKNKLGRLFGDRFLSSSRTLKNSKGSALFEMIFCVGSDSPKAIIPAKRIAQHIVEKM